MAQERESDDATRTPQRRLSRVAVMFPRVRSGTQRVLRFFGRFGLMLLLTVGTLLLPTPEGLSPEGHRALADVPVIEVARLSMA